GAEVTQQSPRGDARSSTLSCDLRGAAQRTVLQHLCVPNADVHRVSRLSESARVEKTQLENTCVAIGQFGKELSDPARRVRLGGRLVEGGPVGAEVDRRDLGAVVAAPVRRQDGTRNREEVRTNLAHRRRGPE